MDAATLADAMGFGPDATKAWLDAVNDALRVANCTTANRVAMFLAQCRAEAGGRIANGEPPEEYADGTEYEGRADLGNVYKDDGPRYKGRGWIQLTGRANYGQFSRWCYDHKRTSSPTWFVDHPEQVLNPPWGLLSAVWYWTVARADLNEISDQGDVVTATWRVNGGQKGIEARTAFYHHNITLGQRLLPSAPPAPKPQEENDDMLMIYTVNQPGSGADRSQWAFAANYCRHIQNAEEYNALVNSGAAKDCGIINERQRDVMRNAVLHGTGDV
jgi:predicted chitinase